LILALAAAAALAACASGGGGGTTSEGTTTQQTAPAKTTAPSKATAPAKATTTTQQTAAAQPAAAKLPAGYSVPPANSKLARVKAGMTDSEVRQILGEPTNQNAYVTGKAFIPFYYGGDTSRTDWMYKGQGRVVFSRNQWSGQLKVIHAMYNPSEP
jgi:hypothetical protein